MRARFEFLDGMRGIAAAAVVALHAPVIFGQPHRLPNAGLAVDFFFCLSGFVVALAYDGKLAGGMGLKSFVWRRFKRLYPMVFLGTLLGSLAAIVTGWGSPVEALPALFLIPVPRHQAFPLNFPMWSLFFEALANVGYGLLARWVGTRLLAGGVVIAGLALVVLIALIGPVTDFGVGGFSFVLGLPRVTYSFGAGVLIFRLGLWRNVRSFPRWILAAVLGGALLMPAEHWTYQAAIVLLGGPALVILGAAAVSKPSIIWPRLGALSYPLYLVHVPVLVLVCWLTGATRLGMWVGAAFAVVGCIAALVLFDEPVRRWLGRIGGPGAGKRNPLRR